MILVDGTALVYRAYYAFIGRPLTAPDGEATSVVFGFSNSVLRLVEQRRPEHLAVVFDRPGPVFRHEMYPDYKAHRKPMPEELAAQLPRLRELLEAWGVAVLERDRYEADDVMATLARRSAGVIDRVWLYTGDKDFMQLLDERTGMLKPGRRGDDVVEFTPAEVRRDYGLEPADLIDVFALSGDASDNIPGAPGIGPKTAVKLIREHGSLEALYADLDGAGLTPRLKGVLAENREQVFLSRRLFTIDCDVPLDVDWENLRTRLPDGPAARELFERLGLRRVTALVERLAAREGKQDVRDPRAADGSPPAETPDPTEDAADAGNGKDGEAAPAGEERDPRWDLDARGYRLLADPAALAGYLETLPADSPLAVDTETDDLRPHLARLVGVSLAAPGVAPAYVPVLTRGGEAQGSLFAGAGEVDRLDAVRRLLAPVLADPRREKVGQNLKFDEWILTRHDMPLGGPRFDTMVAAYMLDPNRPRYGLDELAADHLDLAMIAYGDLFAAGDRDKDILGVPLPRLAVYAAEDADATLRLRDVFAPALADDPAQAKLFHEIEMPLSEVLFRMERRGIAIDTEFLSRVGDDFRGQLAALEARIHEAAGGSFNVQSPKQLAEVLFERLGLKPVKKTSSGWSTDVSVLTALADRHPVPALVLEHRQLAKLLGTYVEALQELVDPDSGLIHTSFNQAVAATGRLSSSDPNLQNIPVRSDNGRLIRRAFVPRTADRVFLSADYSQIELRLLAHLSGDAALIETFRRGGDVHRRTAALINGIDEDAVTPDVRSRAKAINFGVIYGMGARALARQTGTSVREAGHFIDSYFRTYPGVRDFIERTRETARREGAVTTMLGRRRPLPDILSNSPRDRSLAERMAVNTPIQGTAADLIKVAMIRVDAELAERGLGALLLLQVHDELLLEVPRGELDEVTALVRGAMESVADLAVPLVADVHTGANWAEAHD